MGAVGRELVAESPEKQQLFEAGGAKSGAFGPEGGAAEVMNAWPTLPSAVRAGILAMVRASVKGAEK